MNKILKKSICLILAFSFIFGLSACSEEKSQVRTFLDYAKTPYAFDTDVNGVVVENDKWALIWDDEVKRVSFLDKKSNLTWGQIPSESLDKQNQSGITLPQLNSAIMVAYQDPKSMDEIFLYSYDSAYENGRVLVKRIDNGIRVIYDFSEFQFAVPVEYTINDETFDIKIIPAHIAEGEEYKVTAVRIAPFVCGVQNDAENSWLFIPDGSGAIVEPFVSDTLGASGELEVYGHDLSTQLYGYGNKKQQAHMPVFGIKKGNNGLLAIIDSAANAATIGWDIGSNTLGCSTVYPTFRLRGTNLISRPDNFISVTTLSEINIFTDGILLEDICVKYYPLAEEDATITGMADCYRDYLIENNWLVQSEVSDKTAAFKLVGGTIQPEFVVGVPSNKLFALTTTDEAIKIAKELQSKLGSNITFDLVGFGENGVDVGELAGGFTVASKLGGNDGMKKLNKFFKELDVDAFMDFDLISFTESGSGYDEDSAATYASGQVVTYTTFDPITHIPNNDRFFVLSRKNLLKAAKTLNSKAKDMGLLGISLGSVSNTIYSDYATQGYYVSGKMPREVAEIFSGIKNTGLKSLTSSANIYAAGVSSEIIDAPIYSSRFNFTAYDVPFYQMVLKGYVPMSSVSINLCTDQQDALLRCVASGIAPSYTLINNFENELITSSHAFIHSSVYSSNKDQIIKDVNMVADYLETVKDVQIIEYTVLENGITLTRFDNGVYTVVNFTEEDYVSEYGKVKSRSFISGREE